MAIGTINKFIKICENIANANNEVEEALKIGNGILEEYKDRGYIKRLFSEVLDYPYLSFVPLLKYLINKSNVQDIINSPVEWRNDSSWMIESSFCFINIRSCGRMPDITGDIINCCKLLPIIRVNSIHLAPFFECALSIVYAIDSLEVINEEIVNKEFAKYGMNGEEQLTFLIDFIHLLGKSVGFDLEPHTSQYSRVVIENPDCFRWIKLSPDRLTLFENISQEKMLTEEWQNKIIREIEEIRDSILIKYKLKSLSDKNRDSITKIAHREITFKLIEAGIWTVPSHTWKGAGLPAFKKYITKDNYPEFEYISWDNEDHKEHSFGVLTPYKFYDNLPVNKMPDRNNLPVLNKKVLNFFSNIFIKLQERYNFDFVRFDYVDHIFDSVMDRSGKIPISDRITPYIIKNTIAKIRKKKRYIGAMAERMGVDLKNYKKIGFDLILGDDILYKISKNFVKYIIKINKNIQKINSKSVKKSSIIFAIDTHDTGHPYFNCVPYLLYGKYGVAVRHFLSRFCVEYIRPKYEVIGMQDGTTGLYKANNVSVSIKWNNDRELFNIYHNIEDIFEFFKEKLKESDFQNLYSYKNVIYWELRGKDFSLIPVINMDKDKEYYNIQLKVDNCYTDLEFFDVYNNSKTILDKLVIPKIMPLECKLIYSKKK